MKAEEGVVEIRVILGTPPLPPLFIHVLHRDACHADPMMHTTNVLEAAAVIAHIGVTGTAIMGIGLEDWGCARWVMIAG